MAVVWVLVVLVFVVVIVASFFVKRHAESPAAVEGWTRTSEAFRDPTTDRQMRVWLDESGARHYVAEGQLPREP